VHAGAAAGAALTHELLAGGPEEHDSDVEGAPGLGWGTQSRQDHFHPHLIPARIRHSLDRATQPSALKDAWAHLLLLPASDAAHLRKELQRVVFDGGAQLRGQGGTDMRMHVSRTRKPDRGGRAQGDDLPVQPRPAAGLAWSVDVRMSASG
jgi:hypothetical protein